jgi:hypothetical protein
VISRANYMFVLDALARAWTYPSYNALHQAAFRLARMFSDFAK